jgi:hypothetical protein
MPEKVKKDSTRNQRQARRREREKRWLKNHGWQSWEALHTALMNDAVLLISGDNEAHHVLDGRQVSDINKDES